ncbi:MAG TPA: hypothetical protein VGE52_12355, partial [Pirellulales bacterium]
WNKGSGIEPALKKCDLLANAQGTKGKDMRAAAQKLRTVVESYMKLLDEKIKEEGESEKGEDIKSDLYRHLKLLKATAVKFVDLFEYEAQNIEQLEKSNDMSELMVATAAANVKKAVTNAEAAVQSIKADPTPETYNKHFEKSKGEVARKITTALKAIMDSGAKWDVQTHITSLNDFATGDKMGLKLNTAKEEVLAQLKEFTTKLKAVKVAAGL